MRKLEFMRKAGFVIGIIMLFISVMPVGSGLPAQAAEPPQPAPPLPQAAPALVVPVEPPPIIDGHGTGFIPPRVGGSQVGGGMSGSSLVGGAPPVGQPPAFDWRTSSKVTSVKDQGACGSCYAFAAIANFESKELIDTATNATPGPDYSENSSKECNWRELNNYQNPPGMPWGSCDGGNYYMLASLFSQKGVVLESCDPYTPADVNCTVNCSYNKTLLDWRIISTNFIPNTNTLKTYIQNNGPVYTSLWVDDGFNGSYNGSYTLNYTASPGYTNHAVLIVGWNDSDVLHPDQVTGLPGACWIVKNSWGPGWGDNGYFYMCYGSANIGLWSSYMDDWQDYDTNGSIMYYDDDCWDTSWGYSSTTAWGLCNFTPQNNTNATRVEFWTTDATTDVDVYIYDDFDGSSLSNLLTSELDYSFNESGYHSVPLSSPVPLTAGDDVIAVVKFTNSAYIYPVPSDPNGLSETGRTYMSPDGTNFSWLDLGTYAAEDVAIRLRTSGYYQPPEEWYWKPGNWTDYALSGMPDFDQRQDNWTNNVTGNWSYCGPVAVADSLWWFDSKNEPNPVPPPAINDNYGLVTNFSNPWDDHDARNVIPLVNNLSWLMDTDGQRTGMPRNGTNVYDMRWGIDKYLINAGYYGYYYERTVPKPDFYWIEEEIERCEDVVLLLGFWQENQSMPMGFARVGGHYVTCAGVNSNTYQLGISDPCRDNAEAGGPGVVPVPHPYPHNSSVHNDTQYVSHDIYNVSTSPSPGGIWGLPGYGMGINFSDFQFQNCPPEFESQQGIYNASLPVFTEIEYAVAVSPKEDLNEVIDSEYVWLGGAVNVSVHVIDEAWDGTIWDIEIFFWTEEMGSHSVYQEDFSVPLQYCQDYYFNVPSGVPPEIVVLHFSNETGENIGFAFSNLHEFYWKPGNWTDYALSGMPDFDQRQDNWTNPQGNWTYCGPVAVANSLWWFDSKNEPSPIPPPTINDNYGLVTNFSNPWDDHDARNVIPLVNNLSWYMDTDGQRTGMPRNGTNVYDMQWGIDKYLVDTGYYGYYYEKTMKMPNFYWIEEEVERCEDVVLLLGFWQEIGPGYWVRVGGHYVTCAGVDSNYSLLGISDPCRDNAGAGGPGRVPVPHPYPHNSSVHNDTQYVSHDVYNVAASPSPGGFWGLANYSDGLNVSDFQFQNCPPEFEINQSVYEPGLPVYTEIEYAVAVSPKPDLNEVVDSDYVWEEGGPMAGTVNISVHVVNETWNNTIWDIEVLFWTEGNGTDWVYNETFNESLKFCQKYYFNISYPVEPEIIVLHFSNETHDNIGFAFSNPQAANATLIGHLTFPGTTAGRVMNVSFYDNSTKVLQFSRNATIDAQSNFTVDNVTPGLYDIRVKNWTCLSEVVRTINLTAGNTTYVDFGASREGDANGSNAITGTDFSLLSAAYGSIPASPNWNPNCDFNRSGSITGTDFSLLSGNYGKTGDPYP